MKQTIEWKDIPGYEGYYQINSEGIVKSLEKTITRSDGQKEHYPERVLKINLHNGKFKKINTRVHLSKNGISKIHYISKLVRELFHIKLPPIYRKDLIKS